jgi:hypothetical protein
MGLSGALAGRREPVKRTTPAVVAGVLVFVSPLAPRAISDVCGIRLGARPMPRAHGAVDGLAQIARGLLADAITIARKCGRAPR